MPRRSLQALKSSSGGSQELSTILQALKSSPTFQERVSHSCCARVRSLIAAACWKIYADDVPNSACPERDCKIDCPEVDHDAVPARLLIWAHCEALCKSKTVKWESYSCNCEDDSCLQKTSNPENACKHGIRDTEHTHSLTDC